MNAGRTDWITKIKSENICLSVSNPHYCNEALQHYLSFYGINCDQLDEYRCGFVLVKGKKQFQQFFLKENAKGTVYLIHGYLDHSTGLNRTINLLLNENYQVAVIDLPGHGFSEGEKGMIASFDDYLDAIYSGFESIKMVVGKEAEVVGLGHSTGAALLFHACAEKKIKLKGLLLVAPLYHPFKWSIFRSFLLVSGMFFPQKKRSFKRNSNDFVYRHFVKQDPLQVKVLKAKWIRALEHWQSEFMYCPKMAAPVYILQGMKDTTVEWKKNIHFYETKCEQFQAALFKGARHQLLNERIEIRELVHDRIKTFLSDLFAVKDPKK